MQARHDAEEQQRDGEAGGHERPEAAALPRVRGNSGAGGCVAVGPGVFAVIGARGFYGRSAASVGHVRA
jgi:hypothetical protein